MLLFFSMLHLLAKIWCNVDQTFCCPKTTVDRKSKGHRGQKDWRGKRVKERALIRLHFMYASPYFLPAPLLLRILWCAIIHVCVSFFPSEWDHNLPSFAFNGKSDNMLIPAGCAPQFDTSVILWVSVGRCVHWSGTGRAT